MEASQPRGLSPPLPWPAVRRGLFLLTVAVVLLAGAAPLGAAPKPAVRFAFTGDIAMVAGPVASYFSNVSLDLAGDVVLGNLEGTLTNRGSTKCGSTSPSCFAFHAPPSYAPYL